LKTNKALPIEFSQHGFLLEYLQDDASRIVVRKPVQVGVSFSTILKILYLADTEALNFIYTLPTAGDAKDFVLSKFDPIIERSLPLRQKVTKVPLRGKAIYSTQVKRIGESYFFFRSSWSAWRAQSIDADCIVLDELDFMKPEIRKMYEERIEGSTSGDTIYWIGYPSVPNYGIEELFESSDQRFWYIKCPHCERIQTLTWPESISLQKKTYVCKHCRKDLSDDDRRRGFWKASFPGRKIHGYSMNKLMAPWISAKRIIKSFNEGDPKHFFNYTLGLPYVDKDSQIDIKEIEKKSVIDKVQLGELKLETTVCGIDQGKEFYLTHGYTTSGRLVVTGVEVIKEFDELVRRVRVLKPDMTVIDQGPDLHVSKKVQVELGAAQCYLANLRSWSLTADKHRFWELKRSKGLVSIERTESLDCMMDGLRNKSILFLKDTQHLNLMFSHIGNLIPDYQERYGTVRKIWKFIGPDHFGHALNFMLIASNILYPDALFRQEKVIPVGIVYDESPIYGQGSAWARQDFEERINQLNYGEGNIVIPPKKING